MTEGIHIGIKRAKRVLSHRAVIQGYDDTFA
jgi:hypothetical protein